MKQLLAFFFSCMVFGGFAQQPVISIIPQPVELKTGEGFFRLLPVTTIMVSTGNADAKRVADLLSAALSAPTGYKIPVRTGISSANTPNIQLIIGSSHDKNLGDEGYNLKVSRTSITIRANKPAGLFYGMQSPLQLIPTPIESKTVVKNVSWTIPVSEITDYPRFGWRGLMFDVSRHFFTKDQVKMFLDDMVKYKYNLLHLHLTDDQGWRIEIKSLPKLTSVGAWRVD